MSTTPSAPPAPYKPASSHEHAAQTMRQEAARGLWDAELVDEFFSMLSMQKTAA